ncbi:hypothetical protein [Burkholderia contaminans]|uniref:hypothetical protein n=1 Tax=Burkholderia contaminans TaxID=488447 RepID=UPI0015825475|nr:hypothetical protein [Burkholderia contaminans]
MVQLQHARAMGRDTVAKKGNQIIGARLDRDVERIDIRDRASLRACLRIECVDAASYAVRHEQVPADRGQRKRGRPSGPNAGRTPVPTAMTAGASVFANIASAGTALARAPATSTSIANTAESTAKYRILGLKSPFTLLF